MITDVLDVEPSSNCLKESIREEQRDAVSVEEKLKEPSHHPRFNSKEVAFIAPIMAGTVVKTIIQYRRTLWKKMWIKKFMTLKI